MAQPSEVENMGESIGESKMSGEKKAYIIYITSTNFLICILLVHFV